MTRAGYRNYPLFPHKEKPDAFLNWPCYCDKSVKCVAMNELAGLIPFLFYFVPSFPSPLHSTRTAVIIFPKRRCDTKYKQFIFRLQPRCVSPLHVQQASNTVATSAVQLPQLSLRLFDSAIRLRHLCISLHIVKYKMGTILSLLASGRDAHVCIEDFFLDVVLQVSFLPPISAQ